MRDNSSPWWPSGEDSSRILRVQTLRCLACCHRRCVIPPFCDHDLLLKCEKANEKARSRNPGLHLDLHVKAPSKVLFGVLVSQHSTFPRAYLCTKVGVPACDIRVEL